MEPNPKQKQLIESTDGIYLVDAGAGTGKTFTLTRRYANILSKPGIEPRDILLITFTKNAAEEMKERVINHCEYDALDLQEAPIATFHGLCNQLLFSEGFESPQLLGIDNYITSSTRLLERSELEVPLFREFIRGFKERHAEYRDYLRLYTRPSNLLELVYALSAKGVFPTESGWYQAGESYLDGQFDPFLDLFERENRPRSGGSKQSVLRERLTGYKDKCFPSEAPPREAVRGDGKQVPSELFEEAFHEDREELKAFIHDLYAEYVEFALGRNYINFGFLMGLTYVALCERASLRDRSEHPYVMVDEFQDTSEIQFKLAMLLASTNNICAVGDWKQSIYSFQYASVENIQSFEERIRRFREELNRGGQRVQYPVGNVETIELTINYRSTQSILDLSEKSLSLEATRKESVDEAEVQSGIVSLDAQQETSFTEVRGLVSEEEPEAILERITTIVDHPDYRVHEDGEERPVEFGDVAVLSRTREFGLDVQEAARKHDVPVAYEGGVELFKTNPSILLLAWLRVLDDPRSRKGWAVILEEAEFRHDQIETYLDRLDPPEDGTEPPELSEIRTILPEPFVQFRRRLRELPDIPTVARTVFDHYQFNNGFSDTIIDVLRRTFRETHMNLGEIIQFITDNIDAGTTYEVDNRLEENTVTVQTIHAAKGLEYPVVFLGDINRSHFPSSGGGYPVPIQYRDPVGLRQRKIYRDDRRPFQYDNWRTEILFKCLTGEYDEERRLMYVAMTRAEQYLYLSAQPESRSEFFRGLSEEIPVDEVTDPEPEPPRVESESRGSLSVEPPTESSPLKLSPHDLMDESVFDEVSGGLGTEFGRRVHRFAEDYAAGRVAESGEVRGETLREYVDRVKQYLDAKPGTLEVERTCVLPLESGGRRFLFEGVIDLIHESDDRVEVIDYKTDQSTEALEEYRKQLSVYYHVADELYPGREVTIVLYYVALDREIELEPYTREQLGDIARERTGNPRDRHTEPVS